MGSKRRVARLGLLATALLLVGSLRASAQWCSNCVLNSAAPQNAQFNITSATIRGKLLVGELDISTITVSTATAGVFIGSGTYITNLNASQLLLGTVPSAVVAGSYTGITGVGTLTAGAWHGTAVGTQYGGTGQNFVTATTGSLPYFSSAGTMSTLGPGSSGYVLQTQGAGLAPVWVNAPPISGANVQSASLPMSALVPAELPQDISVNDASISTVSAAKVVGNIAGNAANITGTLALSQLGGGTLGKNIVAQTLPATGVSSGTYGGPTTLAQIQVSTMGLVTNAAQFNLIYYATAAQPGALPSGVTIGAAQVTAGTLASNVIASSIAVSGVAPGSYGGAALSLTLTVGGDGRLTSASQHSIAIAPTQLTAGTLPSNVLVPGANIQSGALPSNVIASSVAANGVVAGTYGTYGQLPQITIGGDGRVTAATELTMPSLSTATATVTRDNNWQHAQTSQSSWTILADARVGGDLTANSFIGDGSLIINLTPANISAGTMGADVIASSVAVNTVGDPQLTVTGVTAGSYGTATRVPTVVVNAQGRVTSASDQTVELAGGAANSIPYQTAPNVTGMLAQGTGVLQESAGAPAWTLTPTLTATNITGISGITGLGTQAQALDMGSNLINNVTDPVSAQDAATKNYVDSIANGITWKKACRVATTSTLPANTYNNGSSGVGATLTGTSIGVLTVDGVATSIGDRILVKDEATAANDGIYSVTQDGSGVVYILTRTTDYNTAAEMGEGTAVFINAGSVNVNLGFVQIDPISTVGTDSLAFTQFTGLGEVVVGTGLTKSGNTISIANTAVSAGPYGSASQVPIYTVNAQGQLTAAANASIAIAASAVTSGQLAIAQGGTNLSSAGGTNNRVLRTSDGSTFTMGQVIGPDIAGSTIPLNAINQSGASDGQVVAWSAANSQWQPANSGVTASGLSVGIVPVATGSNALGAGNGFITSVSSGVTISTNVTNTASTGAVVGFGWQNFAEYHTSGAQSFTVPANTYKLMVQEVGDGGGGGGAQSGLGGAGGGGGAYCLLIATATPGQVINFIIGSGGAGGAVGSAGSLGHGTTFYSTIAGGGGGGSPGASVDTAGGPGGRCTGPGLEFPGSVGINADFPKQNANYAPGSPGGASGMGGSPTAPYITSSATQGVFGAGGVGGSQNNVTNYSGAQGGVGRVIIWW